MVGIAGDTLRGKAVTFESAAPAIATVSAGGVVRGAARGTVVITATSGAVSAHATLDVRWGEQVGPAGGSATMWNGAITLDVPPGALRDSTTIYVDSAATPPSDSLAVPGAAFTLQPASLAFDKPASLTVRFRAGAVPAPHEVSVGMFVDSGQAWRAVQGSVLDLSARAVTAPIPGTGLYGLVAPGPVASVTIVGGLLVVLGTSADYRAELRDSAGTLLSNRPIAWRTGDSTVAKVTPMGVVSGVGFGSTPLSASSGGATATVNISIVVICQCPIPVGGRPVAGAMCFCATP
jgi:hypothetical protein